MQDFLVFKSRIEKAHAEQDEGEITELLDILGKDKRISIPILKKTRVGLAVGKLRKHSNPEIARKSQILVKKWKDLVEEEKARKKKRNKNKTAQEPAPEKKEPKVVKEEKPKPTQNGHTNPNRGKLSAIADMLRESLGEKQNPDDRDPVDVAQEIEQELLKIYGSVNAQYKVKFRSLFNNLKNVKNTQLRERVLSGELDVPTLCVLTPKQLASKEKQQRDRELEEYCLREAIRGGEEEQTTDMFTCGKCKESKCSYTQLQTRSADEPMTTFVKCTNCGHRWKFS